MAFEAPACVDDLLHALSTSSGAIDISTQLSNTIATELKFSSWPSTPILQIPSNIPLHILAHLDQNDRTGWCSLTANAFTGLAYAVLASEPSFERDVCLFQLLDVLESLECYDQFMLAPRKLGEYKIAVGKKLVPYLASEFVSKDVDFAALSKRWCGAILLRLLSSCDENKRVMHRQFKDHYPELGALVCGKENRVARFISLCLILQMLSLNKRLGPTGKLHNTAFFVGYPEKIIADQLLQDGKENAFHEILEGLEKIELDFPSKFNVEGFNGLRLRLGQTVVAANHVLVGLGPKLTVVALPSPTSNRTNWVDVDVKLVEKVEIIEVTTTTPNVDNGPRVELQVNLRSYQDSKSVLLNMRPIVGMKDLEIRCLDDDADDFADQIDNAAVQYRKLSQIAVGEMTMQLSTPRRATRRRTTSVIPPVRRDTSSAFEVSDLLEQQLDDHRSIYGDGESVIPSSDPSESIQSSQQNDRQDSQVSVIPNSPIELNFDEEPDVIEDSARRSLSPVASVPEAIIKKRPVAVGPEVQTPAPTNAKGKEKAVEPDVSKPAPVPQTVQPKPATKTVPPPKAAKIQQPPKDIPAEPETPKAALAAPMAPVAPVVKSKAVAEPAAPAKLTKTKGASKQAPGRVARLAGKQNVVGKKTAHPSSKSTVKVRKPTPPLSRKSARSPKSRKFYDELEIVATSAKPSASPAASKTQKVPAVAESSKSGGKKVSKPALKAATVDKKPATKKTATKSVAPEPTRESSASGDPYDLPPSQESVSDVEPSTEDRAYEANTTKRYHTPARTSRGARKTKSPGTIAKVVSKAKQTNSAKATSVKKGSTKKKAVPKPASDPSSGDVRRSRRLAHEAPSSVEPPPGLEITLRPAIPGIPPSVRKKAAAKSIAKVPRNSVEAVVESDEAVADEPAPSKSNAVSEKSVQKATSKTAIEKTPNLAEKSVAGPKASSKKTPAKQTKVPVKGKVVEKAVLKEKATKETVHPKTVVKEAVFEEIPARTTPKKVTTKPTRNVVEKVLEPSNSKEPAENVPVTETVVSEPISQKPTGGKNSGRAASDKIARWSALIEHEVARQQSGGHEDPVDTENVQTRTQSVQVELTRSESPDALPVARSRQEKSISGASKSASSGVASSAPISEQAIIESSPEYEPPTDLAETPPSPEQNSRVHRAWSEETTAFEYTGTSNDPTENHESEKMEPQNRASSCRCRESSICSADGEHIDGFYSIKRGPSSYKTDLNNETDRGSRKSATFSPTAKFAGTSTPRAKLMPPPEKQKVEALVHAETPASKSKKPTMRTPGQTPKETPSKSVQFRERLVSQRSISPIISYASTSQGDKHTPYPDVLSPPTLNELSNISFGGGDDEDSDMASYIEGAYEAPQMPEEFTKPEEDGDSDVPEDEDIMPVIVSVGDEDFIVYPSSQRKRQGILEHNGRDSVGAVDDTPLKEAMRRRTQKRMPLPRKEQRKTVAVEPKRVPRTAPVAPVARMRPSTLDEFPEEETVTASYHPKKRVIKNTYKSPSRSISPDADETLVPTKPPRVAYPPRMPQKRTSEFHELPPSKIPRLARSVAVFNVSTEPSSSRRPELPQVRDVFKSTDSQSRENHQPGRSERHEHATPHAVPSLVLARNMGQGRRPEHSQQQIGGRAPREEQPAGPFGDYTPPHMRRQPSDLMERFRSSQPRVDSHEAFAHSSAPSRATVGRRPENPPKQRSSQRPSHVDLFLAQARAEDPSSDLSTYAGSSPERDVQNSPSPEPEEPIKNTWKLSLPAHQSEILHYLNRMSRLLIKQLMTPGEAAQAIIAEYNEEAGKALDDMETQQAEAQSLLEERVRSVRQVAHQAFADAAESIQASVEAVGELSAVKELAEKDAALAKRLRNLIPV